jgi:pimeloyl-ACP methyl ester carboxylesterase
MISTLVRVPTLFALTLLLAAAPVQAARTWGSLHFEPCTLAAPGMPVTVPAQCTSLEVPEDRSRPRGRRIRLAIAWIPTDAKQPQPDPVVMIAGGPGQSALQSFAPVASAFGEILRHRSVLLVDQRGTGGSHPLNCPAARWSSIVSSAEASPATARGFAEQCLQGLAADPRFYTTSDAIDDLEALRAAVRAPSLNGVVPPELALGADHARNLEAALDAQFERCAADAACARRYGSLRQSLDALRVRLRTEPQVVRFRDPLTNEPREQMLTESTVAGVVRLYAYVPQLFAMLPLSLAEASAGRPEALMAQASMIEILVGEQIAQGMELSVTCSEDARRLQPRPEDSETLMGVAFGTAIKAQCEVWPRGRVPADFHEPVLRDAPVLLLSGEFDPVTPPRYGEQVVKSLPNGRHLVLRGQGHNVMTAGCAPRLMAQFVARAEALDLDARCLDQLIRTPVFTGSYGWEP